MKSDPTKESKQLAPGQVWMSFSYAGKELRCSTTLLIRKEDDDFSWFILRTSDSGRCFTHVPALNFIGDELDEDDEDMVFIRLG